MALSQKMKLIIDFILLEQGGGGSISEGIMSRNGFRFIKGYEGFSPEGLFLSGETFRTVGYGSTEKYNLDKYNAHKPFPCSEQLASEIYGQRMISEFGSRLWSEIQKNNIIVTTNQFDAMCSLAYNRGFGGFTGDSTSPWQLIKLNPNNPSIRGVWEKYAITGSGVPLPGLVARRKAEMNVYELNQYEMRSILKYRNNGSGSGVSNGIVTDNNGDGFIPSIFS